jgi:2-hydroxychromene-2-carboxylate isomerase
MPFGPVHDPIGRGALRCLAVGEHAVEAGRAREFVLEASRGIWAEAIDVATDPGLRRVCERAGLDWGACSEAIGDERLRARVERNTDELIERGHWGVPVFVFREELFWGQDRIEDLETVLTKAGLERR